MVWVSVHLYGVSEKLSYLIVVETAWRRYPSGEKSRARRRTIISTSKVEGL